jgi:hypothetical protein
VDGDGDDDARLRLLLAQDGRDAEDDRSELAGRKSMEALRRDIAAMRAELRPRPTP